MKPQFGTCILQMILLDQDPPTHVYFYKQEERSKVDELRGTPMSVGTLEEIIDDNHAIVSTSVGSEHYVNILSFVDKDLLEPGCTVLLNHKVNGFDYTRKNAQVVTNLQQCCSNNLSIRMCLEVVNGLLTTCYKVVELNIFVTSCSNNLLSSCYSTICQQVVSDNLVALLQLFDKLATSLLRTHLLDKL